MWASRASSCRPKARKRSNELCCAVRPASSSGRDPRITGHYLGVSLETTPVPYLLARSKQTPARMPSRLLPLVVHAGRPRLQDVLSAGASSLPPGAFGLVPPPHDDRWQASVPMITTPNAILNIGNSRWAVSVRSLARRLPGPHGVLCSPRPNPRCRLIVTLLMLIDA